MTKEMQELLNQRSALVNEGETLKAEGKYTELAGVTDKLEALNKSISALETFEEVQKAVQAQNSQLPVTPIPAEPKDHEARPFRNLGEQLKAIVNFRKNGDMDPRLAAVNKIQGNNEGSGSDGGFALQTDFAGAILDDALKSSEILSRTDVYEVSSNANSVKWMTTKRNDPNAVFGGVVMHWAAEGGTAAASKAQFVEAKLDLEKMMGFAYATEELLEDTSFMTGLYGKAFSAAADKLLTEGIISGDGVGKPLGLLKSKALVAVDKEASQAKETLLTENIVHMQARMLQANRRNAVWLMHPDVAELLPFLKFNIGTGGVSVYLPSTGLAGNMYNTLYGKPILEDENCSALGEQGDILFVDLKQVMVIKKGTPRQDTSIHVEFLTDQSCFRVVYRVNAAPKINEPYKIKNSKKLRSPFVTLAARA